MNLTKAQIKGLQAVAAGLVVRIYRDDGNVLKGPSGVSSTTLWNLDRRGYLRDSDNSGSRAVQALTDLARRSLIAERET